ncbi:MAG: hypothetical protein QE263_09435 [Vampirovibrionales bacterium]|nr:hypothetical protein [Vampirovibrionales bacterium]
MKRRQQSVDLNNLVLECDTRRFDGGTEGELIRQIEERQRRQTILSGGSGGGRVTQPPSSQRMAIRSHESPSSEGITAIPLANRHPKRIRLALDCLIVGPLQVAVGIVGVLTAVLALAAFIKSKDEALTAQSHHILKECSMTLARGVVETVLSPLKVLKALIWGA